ncbi:MAG: Nif11-like leader peptide family natural product precursor [Clostridia bacterium]|nr:Nif11-like leader peptide family natural product precursor [Clostridia bacterium]
MTENMKKFLEEASRDKEFTEKLNKADTLDAVVALAAEKGFTLTEEDLKGGSAEGEFSGKELDAVAGGVGGQTCVCVLGGGGLGGGDDDKCVCVFGGGGTGTEHIGYFHITGSVRCFCAAGGGGEGFKEN